MLRTLHRRLFFMKTTQHGFISVSKKIQSYHEDIRLFNNVSVDQIKAIVK